MTVASVAYRNRGRLRRCRYPVPASTVACPKCGCRLVTKVGRRAEGRFVCTDCGRPVDGQRLAEAQRQRWQAALILSLLALVGTLVFVLASANEAQNGGDAGVESVAPGGEESSGEGKGGEGGAAAGSGGKGE